MCSRDRDEGVRLLVNSCIKDLDSVGLNLGRVVSSRQREGLRQELVGIKSRPHDQALFSYSSK